jgi:hypothetical protein
MDLTKAESLIRAHADDTVAVPGLYAEEREALADVLAEYDRRGAIQQRVRGLADEWETTGGLAGAAAAERLRATLDSR